jgi:hypothetical protein
MTTILSARGIEMKVSNHVLDKIPYFDSLMSGRWDTTNNHHISSSNDSNNTRKPNDETIPVDLDHQLLYPCIAYADSDYKDPSLLLTKLSRSQCGAKVVDLARMLCMPIPTVNTLEELMALEELYVI